MVELLLIACLASAPERCEEFYAPFQPRMSLYACMRHGQIFAVEWSRSHPGWVIRSWTCGPPEA